MKRREMEMKKTWFEKNFLRFVFLLLIALGTLGVTVCSPDGKWPCAYAEHLFMALAVSGFIALFVELSLQREFAKNVFEAAVGYLLPEDLQGELSWLYNQKFLCEQHTQSVHISRIADTKLVKIRTEVVRVFRNISNENQGFQVSAGTTEWGYSSYPSKILRSTYKIDGKDLGENPIKLSTEVRRPEIGIEGEKLRIASNERFTTSFEIEETMHERDWSYAHFACPTSNVTVIVNAPEDFDTYVFFGHRSGDPEATKMNSTTWCLRGILLPLQAIRIIWLPKETGDS